MADAMILFGTRVFVYYNLHKKCFSVKALAGVKKGLVVAHSDYVLLSDATPSVSIAGMQRVRRTNQKNVHAGFRGILESLDEQYSLKGGVYITYKTTAKTL